jgi:hypothetical protein
MSRRVNITDIKERRNQMRIPKILWLIAVAVALLAALIPAASQATDVGGKFKVNGKPKVTAVVLTPTTITPGTEYTVTVTVSNPEGVAELTSLVLKLWYDANGGNPSEGEFTAASADTQLCAIVTWTEGGTFVLTPTGGGVTWAIGTCEEPATLPDDFVFYITPGKVATATDVADKWQVAAKVTDDAGKTGFAYDAQGTAMNFYGAASLPETPTVVDFGTVTSGTGFGDDVNEFAVDTVTYIANGDYNEKISTGATWDDGTNDTTLDPLGVCDSADEFALSADDVAAYDADDVVLVTTGGTTINAQNGPTAEAGNAQADYNLWLKVSEDYTVTTDPYEGTITYAIEQQS